MTVEVRYNSNGKLVERWEIVYSNQYGLELVHYYEDWYDVYDDYGFGFMDSERWNCNSYRECLNKYYELKKRGY